MKKTYAFLGSMMLLFICGCSNQIGTSKEEQSSMIDNSNQTVISKGGQSSLLESSNQTQYSTNNNEENFFVKSVPNEILYCNKLFKRSDEEISFNEINQVLGYIIRANDISNFIAEYPDVDYVIYEGVYDYYNGNRVPFYSVKGDVELEKIYCDGVIYFMEAEYD